MPRRVSTPNWGLVCLTASPRIRYRALTRKRLLSLPGLEGQQTLLQLYWENLGRLHAAISYCDQNGIRLYRVTSNLFPFSDEAAGREILGQLRGNLSSIGRRVERLGIRLTLHPDQFVVLNSDSPAVVATSLSILEKHALAFDWMGLPQSPWAAITLHGGKAGRADRLVETIGRLPESVRSRLTLENDEYAYGASEILSICRRAGVPMVLDNHHHGIKERLSSVDDSSVLSFVRAARETWPRPDWQLVHLSNGLDGLHDPRHSWLIREFPAAYADVPWIEVEAKGKEEALADLRRRRVGATISRSAEPA